PSPEARQDLELEGCPSPLLRLAARRNPPTRGQPMMTSSAGVTEKCLTAGLVALAVTLAPPARAGDPATADALFNAAKALMARKKWGEACPKVAASYKLDPTLGTLLNLADCHEKQGLLAQAWSEWGAAGERAEREKDAARKALCARRRAELEPRVPKLNIAVR